MGRRTRSQRPEDEADTPSPLWDPLRVSPPESLRVWSSLGTISAPGRGSKLPVPPSLLPLPRVTCSPARPRLLCPAHLGADVLIGSWADEREADEEDILGTEQAMVTHEARPGGGHLGPSHTWQH